MRFPVPWLREFAPLPEDDALARAFTLSGTEVEGREVCEGETAFEFGITVNRPDCMSAFGLAREASALFGAPLAQSVPALAPSGPPAESLAGLEVRDGDLCPRYRGLVLTGLRVGESPARVQKRLLQCGLRPINAVVDATNYVLLELGHPLHAFDLKRLEGRRIVVRRAAPGEKFRTLDGVDRALSSDMLVIADAARPVAVAGVMGGEESGVTAATTEVLLEGAVFDPVSVRRTSKALGLHTDASHRFERGVAFDGPEGALARCAALILESCGGTLAPGGLEVSRPAPPRPALALRQSRVRALVGLDIPLARCAEILKGLGFGVAEGAPDTLSVTAPPWRVDIAREVDLVEEVVRVNGLEGLPALQPAVVDPVGGRPAEQALEERLRDAFVAAGFSEAVNMSLADPTLEGEGSPGVARVALANPMAETSGVLRAGLAGGLLGAAVRNRARGLRRLALFEVGHVFAAAGERPAEEARVAALLFEDGPARRWGEAESRTLLDLKGALEVVLGAVGVRAEFPPQDRPPFAPGHAFAVAVDGAAVGHAGTLDPAAADRLGLKGRAHLAELSLAGIGRRARDPRFRPFSRFPAVVRDFSVLAPSGVTWSALRACLEGLSLNHLSSVHLVEVFDGRGLPQGSRSWTFSLTFQAPDRTLEEADVRDVPSTVGRALRETLGATLRTGENDAV